MLSPGILDVAIGLALVYLTLSLFCSALTELVATVLGLRWRNLREGIRNLLDGASGEASANQLYNHPLIQGLTQRNAWLARKPSYIPSRTFTVALLDSVLPANPAEDPRTFAEIRSAVAKIPNEQVKKALLALADEAQGDLDRFRTNIQHWFDSAMERVSGWYKRSTQVIILLLGLIASIGLNADTILIANSLLRDPVMRAAVVSAAEETTKQSIGQPADLQSQSFAQLNTQIQQLKLPIGWDHGLTGDPETILIKVVGWLLTTVAVSLGAPFWFDLLSTFVTLRGSGAPPTPSRPS